MPKQPTALKSHTAETEFTELAQRVTTTHRPVLLRPTGVADDVVLMSKQDFETAQAIIKLATGRGVPFMELEN
ncbi:hypothetical protein [Levilactobacillus spicheri]|uniref:Antitoxin n=1 Tax=Levilactobacillus spicheri TaxID=216463 RepID=A0A0F3RTN5_9LACO|nr:hypothetical protein [Levilactobacillus spicheri]KJW13378.1 hypothetical protein VC81_02630 [Levilactobacillus spicheri]